MMRKVFFSALLAILATLAFASESRAWFAYRYGYGGYPGFYGGYPGLYGGYPGWGGYHYGFYHFGGWGGGYHYGFYRRW
jgi:hypothetical protein